MTQQNGAKKLKRPNARQPKYGLELEEYARLELAARQLDPMTHAAIELMRYCGMRIGDCEKFNEAELVYNAAAKLWECSFDQQKIHKGDSKHCTVPIPDTIKNQLGKLDGARVLHGEGSRAKAVKWFFCCGTVTLRRHIMKAVEIAEDYGRKPFAHKFTPHTLRHTFVIQQYNEGVPIEIISKRIGHSKLKRTLDEYWNILPTTSVIYNNKVLEATERMIAKTQAIQRAARSAGAGA